MAELLRMVNITKRFGGITALDNVHLTLHSNELLCLVGENGAGKSTLMKILSGSYPHGTYEGEIMLNGENITIKDTADAERFGIEMIYQEISMHLDLSVAENLFLGHLLKTSAGLIDWKKMHARARELLDRFELDLSTKERMRNLSTSQQQLVSIARAIARSPKILVLDEPTSAITETEAERLFRILLNLKEDGVSCIYISHKLKEVIRLADRISVLRDGRSISTYSREQIEMERIIHDMVGRTITMMYPKENLEVGSEVFRVEHITVPHPYSTHKNIIDDVSFSLKKSEILGIGGLVGAGRSELVNAIFGDLPVVSKQSLFVGGRQVVINHPSDAIRHGIGLLTEDRKLSGFVPTMSIRENMTLACFKKIADRNIIKPKKEKLLVEEFFRKLRIKAKDDTMNVLSLSGGNQQKVVLAKWLLTDLKVLILDEPTRGIDVGAKVEIYKVMTELAAKGIGIIMISSELPELLAMCDRIIVLANGKISDEMQRDEIDEKRYMKAATGAV